VNAFARVPVRLRLTLAFTAAMALVLLAAGAFIYYRLGTELDESIDRGLRARAQDAPESSPERALLSPAELARARHEPTFVDRRSAPGYDDGVRLFATPDAGGRVVVVAASLESRGDALETLLAQLAIGGPVVLLLSALAGYALAGAALRPVESMFGRLEAALERERRFVSDASHELRTPLAALRTELELALRRDRTKEELEQALASAAEETDRLSQLAEDLLVLARAQGGDLPVRRERLEAKQLLEGVADRYASRAAAARRPLVVRAEDDLQVFADRLRTEQALGNLVENAFRHGRGRVELEALRRNGHVELHVRDEGSGFPPGFIVEAFEPFSRSDPSRQGHGAGLGLAIVDVIARAHGGAARAANVDGGADAWLELP
jgi:signal transduction histidine kinase